MQSSRERSRLFHTIVVVGLSVASTECGARTGDELLVGALPEGPEADASENRAIAANASDDGAGMSLPNGFTVTGDDAASEPGLTTSGGPATDAAPDAGDAADACFIMCCGGGLPSVQPCGTSCPPWPCYV
jgi:hypothetical protein